MYIIQLIKLKIIYIAVLLAHFNFHCYILFKYLYILLECTPNTEQKF